MPPTGKSGFEGLLIGPPIHPLAATARLRIMAGDFAGQDGAGFVNMNCHNLAVRCSAGIVPGMTALEFRPVVYHTSLTGKGTLRRLGLAVARKGKMYLDSKMMADAQRLDARQA